MGDAAAGSMDNNNLSSDFVPHITRIAKLMDSKVITFGEIAYFFPLRHCTNEYLMPMNYVYTKLPSFEEQCSGN